ncbi:MAG TPA: hypothetical protein VFX35_12550 [Solirubrobacterales bacterium]|nr:hypothetical protein [Solirubrobacterales bacterium]
MKLRIKALRSLRWNYSWRDCWGLFLEAECDCALCDGCFPQFDVRYDPPREIPCPHCGGRGTEPARERNITQLLFAPDYFLSRQEAKRDLRSRIAEQERAAAGAAT